MKTLKKMVLGILVAGGLGAGPALAGSDVSTAWYHIPSLVGTWQFEMTVRIDAPDCTTAPQIPVGPNPFPGLVSFHEGGTLNEYASRAAPSIRTTGFGSWEQTGVYRYKARHTFMEFDVNGELWRIMVIKQTVKLGKSGNDYTSVARLELTELSSGMVQKICGTIDGVRFKA